MLLDLQVIRHQLQSCVAQRDQAAQTFQQCVGAIAVLEEQLKVIANAALAPKDKAGQGGKAGDCGCDEKTPENEKCEDCNDKGEADGEVKQQEQVEAPKE